MTTNTQLRATCPACFATQALRGNMLVQHGYRRPQHWHQNVNTCTGTGQPHFGTEAGRDYTLHVARRLREGADAQDALAGRVLDGQEDVYRFRVIGYGTARMQTRERVENPTAQQREAYVSRLRGIATQMREQAAELEALVAQWQPREPVAVQVEKKAGPLVHWRTARRWHGHGKACAGSAMGAQRGETTDVVADVTCPKCKAMAQRLATK